VQKNGNVAEPHKKCISQQIYLTSGHSATLNVDYRLFMKKKFLHTCNFGLKKRETQILIYVMLFEYRGIKKSFEISIFSFSFTFTFLGQKKITYIKDLYIQSNKNYTHFYI